MTILSLSLPSPSPGDLPVVVSVRHLDETGPDVVEETLRSFVFLTVDLPAGHLADTIFRPLEVLQNNDWSLATLMIANMFVK